MARRKVSSGIPVTAKTPFFPSPVVSRIEDTDGIAGMMTYGPRVIGAPSVAYNPRSSLGQPVTRYRSQISVYLSKYRTGLQAVIGYPTARGQTILNTAPPLSRRPTPRGNGNAPTHPGAMGTPKRFKKALPAPLNVFNPPVYGES